MNRTCTLGNWSRFLNKTCAWTIAPLSGSWSNWASRKRFCLGWGKISECSSRWSMNTVIGGCACCHQKACRKIHLAGRRKDALPCYYECHVAALECIQTWPLDKAWGRTYEPLLALIAKGAHVPLGKEGSLNHHNQPVAGVTIDEPQRPLFRRMPIGHLIWIRVTNRGQYAVSAILARYRLRSRRHRLIHIYIAEICWKIIRRERERSAEMPISQYRRFFDPMVWILYVRVLPSMGCWAKRNPLSPWAKPSPKLYWAKPYTEPQWAKPRI